MTLLGLLVYLPTVLLGTLVVHLIWDDDSLKVFPIKVSLGIGVGFGLSSVLYFLVLQIAPGSINVLVLQVILLVTLLVITYWQGKFLKLSEIRLPKLTWLQWGLSILFFGSVLVSGLVFANQIIARPQGAFDAWSIWNRAARFIYRDPENWIATLSPDLPLLRHADYPLLIPLNVAWGWEILGNETLRIPMLQAAFFTFCLIFLFFFALVLTRSVGQASMAGIILMGISGIVVTGTGLIADVPLTYFILAAGILIFLYTQRSDRRLLILAGVMAGFAGWTKNEGLLFIAVSPLAVIAAAPKNIKQTFPPYLAGLFVPLAVILYFKTLTPPNDLLIHSTTSLIDLVTDPARYKQILSSFSEDIFRREAMIIFFYTLLMRDNFTSDRLRGAAAMVVLIVLQLLGYAGIYLITPNDLEWQLFTSQYRLFMQIIPLALFLVFSISAAPETVFTFVHKKSDS